MRRPAAGAALLLGASVALTAGAVLGLQGRVPVPSAALLAAAIVIQVALGWWWLRRVPGPNAATAILPLQLRLDKALAKVADLTNSQGRFVGNIAHELKTPLTAVLSQSELLLACCNDPAAVRHYAKSIGEDMRHLSDLVESFLRLARPFAQADTSHHVPVCFDDFVVAAVSRSLALAHDRSVKVVVRLAEPPEGEDQPEVMGDEALLEAMVENLVRNAVRFSPSGANVEVDVQVHGDMIALRVRDHGSGIAAEHLESVFDWFFDQSTPARQSSGTGFGLAIAKRVAEHHHGTISLRNRAEGGCEFEVQLPRWRDGRAAPAPAFTATG